MTGPQLEQTNVRRPVETPGRTPVVLVAEDDPLLLRLIALSLARDGLSVLDASDGEQLDTWVRRLVVGAGDPRCVDLVIADQRMPNTTGLEVLANLRRVDWSTPFILITAFADLATRKEAERLGASCVLDKPFDFHVLRSVARRLAMPELA
jgi:DNA-binding response OmpR family regulator